VENPVDNLKKDLEHLLWRSRFPQEGAKLWKTIDPVFHRVLHTPCGKDVEKDSSYPQAKVFHSFSTGYPQGFPQGRIRLKRY